MADSSSDEETRIHRFKVVVLGDGAVGKTSLIMRFVDDNFAPSYKQTIGVDFFIKRIVLPGDVEVVLQIWDIGGQQLGSRMLSNYISGANALLFAYDISNLTSFRSLEDWYKMACGACGCELPSVFQAPSVAAPDVEKTNVEVESTAATDATKVNSGSTLPEKKKGPLKKMPYLALCANKSDLSHIREVKKDRAQKFALDGNLVQFEVSAKSGAGVGQMMTRIAADLAGVQLSKNELDAHTKIVKAEIVNHPAGERDAARDRGGGQPAGATSSSSVSSHHHSQQHQQQQKKKSGCSLQ
eukprot:ANDGO_07018.mRNA.1 Ras-related protein Rab6